MRENKMDEEKLELERRYRDLADEGGKIENEIYELELDLDEIKDAMEDIKYQLGED